MGIFEILIIAVGLSMDAFAVSICKGLSVCRVRPRNAVSVALWFGGFQALMPVLGFYLGVSFADVVASVDHWIAFILLGIIAIATAIMLRLSSRKHPELKLDNV